MSRKFHHWPGQRRSRFRLHFLFTFTKKFSLFIFANLNIRRWIIDVYDYKEEIKKVFTF